jgi:hypothetical protein
MLISHKYQVIFIHIQRTGGTSVSNVLIEADPDIVYELPLDSQKKRQKHCFISDIYPLLSSEIFSNYTKFSIVRNPYARLLSWYSMFKHKTINPGNVPETSDAITWFDTVEEQMKPFMNSFDDFLSLPNEKFFQRFYYNQLDYLQVNQKLAVDNILRFENLTDDFNCLAQQLNIKINLPHINQSVNKNIYRDAYTKKTQNLVAERFQEDLNYFDYLF